jgi:hypothetical protein
VGPNIQTDNRKIRVKDARLSEKVIAQAPKEKKTVFEEFKMVRNIGPNNLIGSMPSCNASKCIE